MIAVAVRPPRATTRREQFRSISSRNLTTFFLYDNREEIKTWKSRVFSMARLSSLMTNWTHMSSGVKTTLQNSGINGTLSNARGFR